jgi:hypothetical protein
MGDPNEIRDKMEEWENRIDDDSHPKFKFPLEIKDSDLDVLNTDMKEPDVKKPQDKKKTVVIKTIENKNKKNKKSLF